MSNENADHQSWDTRASPLEAIALDELLARARRDELMTVADLEALLAAQGTPVRLSTLRDWIRLGTVRVRRLPRRERARLRVPGHEVVAVLQWRRGAGHKETGGTNG